MNEDIDKRLKKKKKKQPLIKKKKKKSTFMAINFSKQQYIYASNIFDTKCKIGGQCVFLYI